MNFISFSGSLEQLFLTVAKNNFGNKIPFSQFHKSFFLQYERQKKLEREHKKKQEAQSLEETKEQITQLEKNLTNFKKDKHELFHTLKKVLFEDDTRRRSKEAPHPPQPQLYMQSAIRPPHGSVYMKPNPQLLITSQPAQPQPVKRPRSPSPTRSGIPAVYYRNALHSGPSSSRYPVTTAYSSVPTTAHSHYTSYPGKKIFRLIIARSLLYYSALRLELTT